MEDRELIRALKALADVTRFRMLQEIAAAGELSCGEIAEHFDVSQPTISHHLKILGDAELVIRRSEGKHHFLSINDSLLEKLVDLLPVRLARGSKAESPRSAPSRPARRK
jgi:ArsR family transcriptional regulator